MKFPLLLIAFLAASALPLRAAEKPNVLLICVDDLKPTIGAYGDKLAQTPNLDRLTARSVLFERAYCNQAVCSPSRNALMTGLRPQTLGIYDLATNFRKARPDAVTLAQYFRGAGYRTEAMGKIFHVGHGNSEDAASWTVPHVRPKGVSYALAENNAQITPEQRRAVGEATHKLPRGTAYESADVPDDAYNDGQIAQEAVERLRAAKETGAPFFIAVGFLKPHLPFNAPKKYWDLYDRSAMPLAERRTAPDGAPDYAGQPGGELRNYRDIPKKGDLPEDLQRTLIHGYYAATSYMDAQLGRVLAALDETGLAANTIVVVWGDHGWHLGDHGMWCKHTNYEQAARIPLIIAAPGAKAGAKTAALVETVDLYPTLAELAGLPAPAGLDGKSFAAVLRDPSAAARDSVTHVYPRGGLMGRAIRTARHRMVEWKKPGDPADSAEVELYDYEVDPLETRNLATAQSEIVARLRAILAQQPEAKPQISAKPSAEAAPAKPQQDRAKMFTGRDKNKDGQLSREEFLANQPDPEKAPARFPTFDADKNGVLSLEEFVQSGKPKP